MAAPADLDVPTLVQRLRSGIAAEQTAAAVEVAMLTDTVPNTVAQYVRPSPAAATWLPLATGSAPALVRLLTRSRRATVQEAACRALAGLARVSPDIRALIGAGGAIPPLASLLHTSSNDGVLSAACHALSVLLFCSANAAAVAATNSVPRLLQLLRDSTSTSVQGHAAVALQQLAGQDGAAAEQLVARVGIPLLVQRLQSSDALLLHGAAGTLAVLAGTAGWEDAIVEAGGAVALARVLRNCSIKFVQCFVAGALASLAGRTASCAAAVAAAGCIPRLVQLLQASRDEHTLTDIVTSALPDKAAQVLCNLLTNSPAAAAAIKAAGGHAALQEHAHSQDPRLQEVTARALVLLPEHAPRQPAPPAPHRVCAAEGCAAATGLRRCAGCGRVLFCSVACGQAHWRTHRRDCKRWRAEAEAEAAAPAAAGEAAGQH